MTHRIIRGKSESTCFVSGRRARVGMYCSLCHWVVAGIAVAVWLSTPAGIDNSASLKCIWTPGVEGAAAGQSRQVRRLPVDARQLIAGGVEPGHRTQEAKCVGMPRLAK